MKNKSIRLSLFYAFVLLVCIIWLSPLLFIVLSSLKSTTDFFTGNALSLPSEIRIQNFADAWVNGNMAVYIKNGLKVSIIKVPVGVLIEALTAFALTRLDIPGSRKIFVFFLIGMMIPMQVTLVALNIGLTKIGLINTHLGLILIQLGFGLPFGILVMRGFFRSIPGEIDESAKLDGCNNLRLFYNILLPLAKPAAASLIILDFLASWNEFLFSSIFLTTDSLRTVPAGLMSFFGEYGTDYPLFTAGVLISIIPVLIIYIFCQRFFVEGIAGAVKG